MASGPLVVAGVAAALLVVTLGFDATMTTTYSVDVWTGSAWRELARMPYSYDGRSAVPYSQTTISANQSDDVRFRVRVDNGYFWATSHTFAALHQGDAVADGTITALARTQETAEFTVPAQRLFDGPSVSGKPVVERSTGTEPAYVDLYVEVEGNQLYANFVLQEVSA